jgi:sugar phosphate permease
MNDSPEDATQLDAMRATLSRWRRRIIGLLWIAYAGFYLCRVNLAAAQKDLAADRGLSKQQLGSLIALLKVFYASGQFINGMLADRLSPRVLIAVGLAVSAGLNMAFAHLNEFRWMAVAWAANGYFQAFGWTSVVRITANWFPPRLRDAASGVLGTSYILGSGISWLVAGRLTQMYGWRSAFWVPAWICLGLGLGFVLLVKQRPEEVGAAEEAAQAEGECEAETEAGRGIASPQLWALGCANLCMMFGYHGLLDWMPHYLAEAGKLSAGAAASRAFLMPLGGALGCLALTWVARRRRRRLGAIVAVVIPLLLLAGLTYGFPVLTDRAPAAVPGGLLLLGVLSSPPASMMACAMPADIGGCGAAGAAAGLVDAMGYAGSALSGWASGRIMQRVGEAHGNAAAWRAVWRVWPLGMMAAAALVAIMSRRRPA